MAELVPPTAASSSVVVVADDTLRVGSIFRAPTEAEIAAHRSVTKSSKVFQVFDRIIAAVDLWSRANYPSAQNGLTRIIRRDKNKLFIACYTNKAKATIQELTDCPFLVTAKKLSDATAKITTCDLHHSCQTLSGRVKLLEKGILTQRARTVKLSVVNSAVLDNPADIQPRQRAAKRKLSSIGSEFAGAGDAIVSMYAIETRIVEISKEMSALKSDVAEIRDNLKDILELLRQK